MSPLPRSIGLLAAAGPLILAACGLLGGGSGPRRLASDVPGPFEQDGPLVLCVAGQRLDAPGSPGVVDGSLGLCVGAGQEAAACSSDGECGQRERCVCGACRVVVCRTNADCLEGLECMSHDHRCQRRCMSDPDCPPGQVCDPTTLGCAAPCAGDGDCSHGEVCSSLRSLCITLECSGAGCGAGRACEVQRRTTVVSRPALLPGPEPVIWATVQEAGIVRFVRRGDWWLAEPPYAVLDPPARDPSVRPGSGLVLVAGADGGSALRAWTSLDGIDWSPMAGDGFFLRAGDGWESGWVGRPSLLADGGGWLVAYEGGPGRGIGLVRLDSAGAGSRIGSGPVLVPGETGEDPHWTSIESLGSPFLFVQECGPGWSGTGLLFEATGLERIDLTLGGADPPEPNASVGYARLDGVEVVVDPYNPLFTTTAGIAVTRSEHAPAIVCSQGVWTLYYEASDPGTGLSEGLFRALSY